MAVVQANILGVTWLSEFAGADKGGVAIVSFDLNSVAATAGDTIKLGASGYDDGVATTSTLAAILATRRRDGKTVTLTGVAGTVAPGAQGSTLFYPWSAAVSAGNVQSIVMSYSSTSAAGSAVASTAFDKPAVIAFTYVAS